MFTKQPTTTAAGAAITPSVEVGLVDGQGTTVTSFRTRVHVTISPQGAVKEGRERVYAAIANSGYTVPLKRITG